MTSQMLWPSATTNSGCLAAAKVSTKLAAKISPNGNTGRQLAPAPAALAAALGWRMALPAAHFQRTRMSQTDRYRMIRWKYLIPQFRKRNFDYFPIIDQQLMYAAAAAAAPLTQHHLLI